jgi:putative membrane protein
MMGGYNMMGGMGGPGMLLMGMLWIGVIALIVWGLMSMFRAQQRASEPDAQEILKRRYARGEISREEFEQARTTLR